MMLDRVELAIRGGILAASGKGMKGKQAGRTGKNLQSTPGKDKRRSGRAQPADSQVGKALRSVYQQTIDEAVPQEMLDLLNKLG